MQAVRSLLLVGALALALQAPVAFGEPYPTRPVRLIVGYPAGAQSDTTARLVGMRLAEILGQSVVVENRSGAAATIAADIVARSVPDGYTLLLGGFTNLALAPLLFSDLRYDPVRDFAHIGRIARVPWMLAVNTRIPVTTLAEFLDYARARPGEVTFATSSSGTQLTGTMLMNAARVDVVHVPYKGTAPAVADVVGGHLDLTLADLAALAPHLQSGKLRLLATTGPHRVRAAPNVPTVAEQGFPGFSSYSWGSLAAPRDTPAEVVAILRRALRQVLREPEFRESLERIGFEPVEEDPEAFSAALKSEIERFKLLVKQTDIRLEIQ